VIDVMVQLKGVDKLMASNEAFRKRLPGMVLNGMRNQIRRTITTVKRDIRTQSGIGQTIWGKNGSGLDKVVTLIQARVQGTNIETGIKLKGIPVLIEEGGRINPHFIRNGFGRSGNRIPHPGMNVRSHFFARTALDRDSNKVLMEVRLAVQKLIGQTFGQAA
jgi:hypothetical protein